MIVTNVLLSTICSCLFIVIAVLIVSFHGLCIGVRLGACRDVIFVTGQTDKHAGSNSLQRYYEIEGVN